MEDKVYTLQIPGRLPGLNEYITALDKSKYEGGKMKSEAETRIGWCIKKYLRGVKFTNPVAMQYEWHEKDCRRDKDNIAFAKKFVQDALVRNGVLKNDGWGYIDGFSDLFFIDKNNARIVVRIWEIQKSPIKIPTEQRCPVCGQLLG